MPQFFDDVLRKANSTLGVDVYADPTKVDPFKKVVIGVKAQPKKCVSVDNSWTSQSEWKGDNEVASEKTATKVGINHGDCKTSWTFANDKFAFNAQAFAFAQDGWKLHLGGGSESKPAKGDWKVEGSADVQSPDFGGAQLWLNLAGEHNNKSETTVKSKLNMVVSDEYKVGVSAEHNTKDFKKLLTHLVWNNNNGNFWLRSDNINQTLGAGCHHTHGSKINHVFEAVYSWDKNFNGFRGQPVEGRFGVSYQLSDESSIAYNGSVGKNVQVSGNVGHRLDKHWSVGANQHFDSSKIGTKQGPY